MTSAGHAAVFLKSAVMYVALATQQTVRMPTQQTERMPTQQTERSALINEYAQPVTVADRGFFFV